MTYCIILILSTVAMITSRKLQNQSITKYNGQHLYFHHQWIQTLTFFVSRTFLFIFVVCPCYNSSSGISQTYHSQLLNKQKSNMQNRQSRYQRCKSRCFRHCIYFILSLCLVFGQFLANIALYSMPCSMWFMMTSIIILYITAFKFYVIKAKLTIFLGVFCIFTGNIMVISTELHTTKITQNYDTNTAMFGVASLCLALLFMTVYFMIYEYFYTEYRTYCNALIQMKTFNKTNNNFSIKHTAPPQSMVFCEWNHLKFLFMEGIYGMCIVIIIILVLASIEMDNNVHSWPYYWFYEDVSAFLHCIGFNELNLSMLVVYMLSVIANEVTLELSKSYLSPYHGKLIYIFAIIMVWTVELLLHLMFSPHSDTMSDGNKYFGESVTWYIVLEGAAFLFIVLGVVLFDEQYIGYLLGMIEHNGLIIKQQRINALTKHWNAIYYKKEKERLCGFSPIHLKHKLNDIKYDNENEQDEVEEMSHFSRDESSFNYHELSINSYNRDGTKLTGTVNLLIGDGVDNALAHGPSKYYPSLYE